jgi:hypothetical protein
MSSRDHRSRAPVDLRAAAVRLRENPPVGFPGRNGRPRTRELEPSSTAPEPASISAAAATTGTRRAQAAAGDRVSSGAGERRRVTSASGHALEPKLLSLASTARYLDLAPWTVRELEWAGVLLRVRVPLPGGRQLRKILFDRDDLDRLIRTWKDAPPPRSGDGEKSAVAGGRRPSTASRQDAP